MQKINKKVCLKCVNDRMNNLLDSMNKKRNLYDLINITSAYRGVDVRTVYKKIKAIDNKKKKQTIIYHSCNTEDCPYKLEQMVLKKNKIKIRKIKKSLYGAGFQVRELSRRGRSAVCYGEYFKSSFNIKMINESKYTKFYED